MDLLINWLLEGEPSIADQTKRDLLNVDDKTASKKICTTGWCYEYMKRRNQDGSWGRGFYQPKWTSTHYTLLELKNLCYPNSKNELNHEIERIAIQEKGIDGGINPCKSVKVSDVCVNGMFLNYSTYFGIKEDLIRSTIDFILSQKMLDGGYNCNLNRSGAHHSSLHTTLSVLEGFQEYLNNGYTYREKEIRDSIASGNEFMLMHHLYLSDHTQEIIDKKFLKLTYPYRWRYTILRALEYFSRWNYKYDLRMKEGIESIIKKRTSQGRWKMQSGFAGEEYFNLEKAGEESQILTLFCLRILKKYGEFLA